MVSEPGTNQAGRQAGNHEQPVRELSVLHVPLCVSDSRGGAGISLQHLLRHLQGLGVHNSVLPVRSGTSAQLSHLRALGVRVLDAPDRGPVRCARAVRRAVSDLKPDVVHSSVFEADLAARLGAVGSGALRVVGLVNTEYAPEAVAAARSPLRLETKRRLHGLMARNLTDRFHALTQSVAEAAVQSLGIEPARIRVIPRGRDRAVLGEPSPNRGLRVRTTLGLPPDAEIVLNVARHEPQKGLPLLIAAFAEVAAERPRAILLQAGREGAATPTVIEEIDRRGLADRVRLLGPRSDVPDLLAACDVFAFSSLWEGIGGAVLEAMAMEAPVVTFRVPGVCEVLGGHGEVCEIGDVGGLAAGVLRMLDDRDAARLHAVAARARFETNYTIEVVATQMADFYRDAVRELG